MSKETNFIKQIQALKRSVGFYVKTESDRRQVCRVAQQLKRYGKIDFDIVTKRVGNVFKVAAI